MAMTPQEQLAMIKDMTRKTGCLHEIHVAHLKAWPRALFNLEKCRAEVSFAKHQVTFRAKLKGKSPKNLSRLLNVLGVSVQGLLGNEWSVRFYNGRKCLLTLDAVSEPPQSSKYEGTDFEAGRVVPETGWNYQKKD